MSRDIAKQLSLSASDNRLRYVSNMETEMSMSSAAPSDDNLVNVSTFAFVLSKP